MNPPASKYYEYQKKPLKFISECLDKNPRWFKQQEIIESVRDNRNTYVKSCHGVGKTHTAKDIALWFLYCHKPATVISTAPSWPQVEKLLWAEINYAHSNAISPLGGYCKKTELFLDDNWFALGISPRIDTEDDGKRMTGFHNEHMLVIFDEGPACNPKLWEIKDTLMTSENVRFLAIGNPVENSGAYYEGFTDPLVNSIDMLIFDSPNFKANNINNVEDLIRLRDMDIEEREAAFSKMYIPFKYLTVPRWAVERLIKWGYGSPLFDSRVLGQFPRKTTDTIISLTDLELCKNIEPIGKHPRTLGVDVARFGNDNTVFIGYENYKQIYKERFNGQNLVKTAELIKYKIASEKYTKIVIDDTGLGGGVTDMVMDFAKNIDKVEIIPVNFAWKSSQEEYDGIVTEMYYNAKDMIEDKRIQTVDEGSLFAELTNRKYKFIKGKIKAESKDEYKKRTKLSSPDEGDAFILCCWGIEGSTKEFFVDYGDDRETTNMDW